MLRLRIGDGRVPCGHVTSSSRCVKASSASARTATPLGPFGQPRLRFVRPRRAGDVEVGPRQAAGELLQEHRRRAGAGRAAAGVHHVGDLAAQLIGVLVVERHRPAAIAGRAGRPARMTSTQPSGWPNRPDAARPSATTQAPVSVATSTRCVAPSCCAYQSPSPRISRPSASVLITSTVLPLAAGQHVAGLHRPAAGHVLGRRHDADDADRRLEQGDRAHRADDGGAAGHVVLHPLHAVGRLDRDAAGVEGDALADEPEHRRLRARPAGRGA